jgi:hypothetical protein
MSIHNYIRHYYGYPACCVKAFYHDIDIGFQVANKQTHREIRRIVSNNTGFVPCYNHACKILNNEITLSDLIKNRECKEPFIERPQCPKEQFAMERVIQIDNVININRIDCEILNKHISSSFATVIRKKKS